MTIGFASGTPSMRYHVPEAGIERTSISKSSRCRVSFASSRSSGTTWRFQAFLRDPGFVTGVNTSDAIEIVLLP